MSNTVAGRLQFDNSQECTAKKRQWRRHANENTLERNASIVTPRVSQMLQSVLTLVSNVIGVIEMQDSVTYFNFLVQHFVK